MSSSHRDANHAQHLSALLIFPDDSIHRAMACIDRNAKGIALVVDFEQRLRATVTDGDIRRAILAGMDLNSPVKELLQRRTISSHRQPVTAPKGTPKTELIHLMNENYIRHIPLLDDSGRVVDLVLKDDLFQEDGPPLSAIVMAGGFGTRLRPLTEDIPKPMLPLGGRPLMEHIIRQFRDAGIRQVSIATHYQPQVIVNHFGDGQRFGVDISYVNEDRPLGTAGALGLLSPWITTLLVINGDILTRLNYKSMLDFHRENKALMTVGVRQHKFEVPYGVIDMEGENIRHLSEKPTLEFFVNAGVYFLEPSVYPYIRAQQRMDMTDLIQLLLGDAQSVVGFPISEYWLDIGQHSDYAKAKADIASGRFSV